MWDILKDSVPRTSTIIAFPSATSFLASSTLIRATSASEVCPSFVIAPPGLGDVLAETGASDDPFELEQANERQVVRATNTMRREMGILFIYLVYLKKDYEINENNEINETNESIRLFRNPSSFFNSNNKSSFDRNVKIHRMPLSIDNFAHLFLNPRACLRIWQDCEPVIEEFRFDQWGMEK